MIDVTYHFPNGDRFTYLDAKFVKENDNGSVSFLYGGKSITLQGSYIIEYSEER